MRGPLIGFIVFWLGVFPFIGVLWVIAGIGIAAKYGVGPLRPYTDQEIREMAREAWREHDRARK